MRKEDSKYVEHILGAISKIEKYLKGYDFARFSKTDILIDAVMRELEIIGEASNRLSDEFYNKTPEIPWSDIIGMRNKLIHDYFGVNLNIVWDTTQRNLKELKKFLRKVL